MGRLDFKSSERRTTSLVGSTPTLFRQIFFIDLQSKTYLKKKLVTSLLIAFIMLAFDLYLRWFVSLYNLANYCARYNTIFFKVGQKCLELGFWYRHQ